MFFRIAEMKKMAKKLIKLCCCLILLALLAFVFWEADYLASSISVDDGGSQYTFMYCCYHRNYNLKYFVQAEECLTSKDKYVLRNLCLTEYDPAGKVVSRRNSGFGIVYSSKGRVVIK